MKMLGRCAVFLLLACTVPLPYFTIPRGMGVVPLLGLVILAVIPKLTATVSALGIVIGLLQAVVWVVLLWLVAGYAQRRFTTVADGRRMPTAVVAVLALIALAFVPIYTTPGDATPWSSAVGIQGGLFVLLMISS